MAKHILLCAAALWCAACAPKGPEADWHEKARLTAAYFSGGETVPMNLIVLRTEKPDEARLIILLSPFDNLAGDCLLKGGRSQCRTAGPAAPLARRTSGILAREMESKGEFWRPRPTPLSLIEKDWSLTIQWPEK